jgi:hypothetical protein
MDEEIKTQANDELAQALASVSDDAMADMASPRVAATTTTDDDFSDFAQTNDQDYAQAPAQDRGMPKAVPQDSTRRDYSVPAQAAPVTPVAQDVSASAPNAAKLEDIKDRALSELRPLMESIDIPAQEKYETYLMMLRASDDRALIEPTFKAARMIEDDKLRAKALLDIIHEINYLSSKAQA